MLGNQQNQEEDVNTLKLHKLCRCVPPSDMSNTGMEVPVGSTCGPL